MSSPTLLMRCLKAGCPRKKRVARALCPDVPKNAVEVHSFCPWHEGSGWKAYPEYFYDAKGHRLDGETGERIT